MPGLDDIEDVIRIEMNKAIQKTLHNNPTARILNIDEVSLDEIIAYFQKSRFSDQLEYIFQSPITKQEKNNELGRWFTSVIGEIYTITVNKQSRDTGIRFNNRPN